MTMKLFLYVLAAALVASCSLTPKQMEKLDGVICNAWRGYGVENTTVAIGGASKPAGVMVTPQCAVAIDNAPKEPAAVARPSLMEMETRQ
jgi:hypothetical protein